MALWFRSSWQKAKKPLEVVGIIAVCVLGIAFIVFILKLAVALVQVYIFHVNVPGLSGKNYWDWLQLLIIPAVLAVGGYLFNYTTSRNEQKNTQLRDQTERDIASDNQREAALQSYLDKMSELLLEKRLRKSKPEDEVRNIGRVRTLTILSRLDVVRKKSVIQFLYESRLIDKSKHIVDLDGADLRDADLRSADLRNVNLSKADLSKADLSFANLDGADLNRAQLEEATLGYAKLNHANLYHANLHHADLNHVQLYQANLVYAQLVGANLSLSNLSEAYLSVTEAFDPDMLESAPSYADLIVTNLSRANLSLTYLSGALLSRVDLSLANLRLANLSKVDLSEANLGGADLSGADLGGANLSGANLSGANLSGAKVTVEQLNQAKSLQGATMPDGSKHS